MSLPRRIACVALFACLPFLHAPALAKTTDNLESPDVLAIANGRNYPAKVVEIMLTGARMTRPDATLPQMVDSLVENQVLTAQALKEFSKQALLGENSVGFEPEVILEDQYTLLMRTHFGKEMDAFVRGQPGGNLDALFVKRIANDDPSLRELMTLRNTGEVRLTPQQMELAKKTVVTSLRMPDGQTQAITFADIDARQHVQGRVRLIQDRDLGYLDFQVKQRVESLFIQWWTSTKSGLRREDITLLRTLLEEKHLKEQYLAETGVVTAMHEDTTETLQKLQKAVTPAEIKAWYDKNKEEFRQIERVKARHIQCKTEQECASARTDYEKSKDFAAAVKKYSIAASKSLNPPGTLGTIERKNNTLGWLGEVAMIGKKGQLIGPIREPGDAQGNAYWQLVLIDDRIEGYAPADSDTVRYQAREEIARKKAIESFKAQREKLLAATDVRRNPKLMAARAAANPPGKPLPASKQAAEPHGHGHKH